MQVGEVDAAGPHGPLPVALKKSLIGPQVDPVRVMGPSATDPCAGMVALLRIVTTVNAPAPFVTVSVTFTPVRAAVPQLVTDPETVYVPPTRTLVGRQPVSTPITP